MARGITSVLRSEGIPGDSWLILGFLKMRCGNHTVVMFGICRKKIYICLGSPISNLSFPSGNLLLCTYFWDPDQFIDWNHPSPPTQESEEPVATHQATAYWREETTQILWEFLDPGSELVLTLKHPKCHHANMVYQPEWKFKRPGDRLHLCSFSQWVQWGHCPFYGCFSSSRMYSENRYRALFEGKKL